MSDNPATPLVPSEAGGRAPVPTCGADIPTGPCVMLASDCAELPMHNGLTDLLGAHDRGEASHAQMAALANYVRHMATPDGDFTVDEALALVSASIMSRATPTSPLAKALERLRARLASRSSASEPPSEAGGRAEDDPTLADELMASAAEFSAMLRVNPPARTPYAKGCHLVSCIEELLPRLERAAALLASRSSGDGARLREAVEKLPRWSLASRCLDQERGTMIWLRDIRALLAARAAEGSERG